jgi:UDP-hydrolysing UDP-N-acetyl-D-glucosamine 2-epimerase
MALRICAVSGGRADYGLLVPVLQALRDDARFDLQLVVTGQHMMADQRAVRALIAADGLTVSGSVEIGLGGDEPAAVIEGAGNVLRGMAGMLAKLAPDMLLVLGDRYEIVCVALAATIAGIPIAHIAGGDLTFGAFDDAFRHSLTKMSHLHFVTNADAKRRVRQLGEPADRVHVVGSPGLDRIRTMAPMPREAFFRSVGLEPLDTNLVVTFHPETLAADPIAGLDELLAALDALPSSPSVLFTGSNADPGGRHIDERIEAFVRDKRAMRRVASLGSAGYFAALTHMDAVVGNSSSGLYEAPSFGVPTVNIGDRQSGRLKAESVFDCAAERGAISRAIAAALARGRKPTRNPYGDGHAAERIVAELGKIDDPCALLNKRFIDLEAA